MDQGRRAGLISVCAIETGDLIHVTAAMLGLSAMLFSSILAFTIVKYLGATHLVYLGLRKLFTRQVKGVLVATLNQKTKLFFVAYLPQFVDQAQEVIT